MIKIINELVYLFTDKLDKKYLIQMHNGYPSAEDQLAIINKVKDTYGAGRFILTFDDIGGKTTVDVLYFKKQ